MSALHIFTIKSLHFLHLAVSFIQSDSQNSVCCSTADNQGPKVHNSNCISMLRTNEPFVTTRHSVTTFTLISQFLEI